MGVWYEHRVHGTSTVMTDRFGACWVCGGPTNSIDVCFEAYQHQGACAVAAERSYWKAVTRG